MVKTSICAFSTLLVSAAFTFAEPFRQEPEGPTESDLQFYFACSEVATQRVLSFEEATVCGKVFQRIKLSFMPGVDLTDFQELAPAERATVNRVAYSRYLDWSTQHAKEVEELREKARSAFVIASE